jgi:von Willebrand factor type A domain
MGTRVLIGAWVLMLLGVVSWLSQSYAQFHNGLPQNYSPSSPNMPPQNFYPPPQNMPPQNFYPPAQNMPQNNFPPNGYSPMPAQQSVLIILDASYSMNERLDGKSKIQWAKDVVFDTLRSLPPNVNVGLRVYGHKLGNGGGMGGGYMFGRRFGGPGWGGDEEACRQSELLDPVQQNSRASIASQLVGIQAVGKTPIAYSLSQAVNNDLAGIPGKKTIILVSDGQETCGGDPCNLAVDFVRSGVDVKINTIGLLTRDRVADDQLKCIALATKGKFYSANTSAELVRSMQESSQVQTSVQAKISPVP